MRKYSLRGVAEAHDDAFAERAEGVLNRPGFRHMHAADYSFAHIQAAGGVSV